MARSLEKVAGRITCQPQKRVTGIYAVSPFNLFKRSHYSLRIALQGPRHWSESTQAIATRNVPLRMQTILDISLNTLTYIQQLRGGPKLGTLPKT
ncbi:hypothetical protein [Azotobacter armeniacus]